MPHRTGELTPATGLRARYLRLLLGVAVGTLTVAGAFAPATAASAASRSRCAIGTDAAIAESYSIVFSTTPGQTDPATSTPERAARLQGGDDPALQALIAQWLAAQAGPGGTLTAAGAICVGRTRAVAHTALQLGGTPMPKVLTRGSAVLDGGVWKVSRATFCERMRIENPALASAGPCATRRADRALPLPTTTTTPSRTVPSTTTTAPPAPADTSG